MKPNRHFLAVLVLMAMILLPTICFARIIPLKPVIFTPELTAQQPDLTIVRTPGDIQDAVWSADGQSLYVLQRIRKINYWETVSPFLPHLTLALSALWAIYLLIRCCRMHHVARVDSQARFCRSCRYRLTQCTSDHCPECGLELQDTNRVLGARYRRTLMHRLVSAALLLILAAGVVANDYIRHGHFHMFHRRKALSLVHSETFDLTKVAASTGTVEDTILVDAVDQPEIMRGGHRFAWLMQSSDHQVLALRSGDDMVVIDATTGAVFHHRDLARHWPQLTPDGESLQWSDQAGNPEDATTRTIMDIKTGTIRRHVPVPPKIITRQRLVDLRTYAPPLRKVLGDRLTSILLTSVTRPFYWQMTIDGMTTASQLDHRRYVQTPTDILIWDSDQQQWVKRLAFNGGYSEALIHESPDATRIAVIPGFCDRLLVFSTGLPPAADDR